MSGQYIEASAEDVASGAKVRVVLVENERQVHLCGLPYHIVSGGTTDVVRCDFLADIIVRGIRSLEEERTELASKNCLDDRIRSGEWQDDDMGGRCGYGDD